MINKKLIAIMLSLSLVAALCACSLIDPASSSNSGNNSAQSTTSADDTQEKIVSVESDEISFYDATDSKGNSLKLSPIYDKEGKSVIAAYIITAFDKNANPLDAKAYPLLNCVVAATSGEKSISLTENADKQLIKIETYADANGNIIAIQDINDINKNNNKTEFIKLTKQTNDKGSVHYLLTNEVIEIKEEKGKKVAVEDGKKTEVKKVDSSNKTVAKKTEKDTASTSEKKDIDKKQSTTKKGGDSSGGNSSGGNSSGSQTSEEKTYMNIVLKKNGKASSSASGVECNQNEVIINNPGDYKITSETDEWHGGIKVKLKNDEEAELRFEDVNISYNKGNIIQLIDESDNTDRSFIEAEATAGTVADDAIEELSERTSAPNVSLSFPTGTTSTFENTANVYTGVIYNEAKLTFKGNGKVNLKAAVNSNNVISSSKAITIKNVSMYLETAAAGITSKLGGAKGIFSYGKVNLESGTLTINSNGDAIRCDEYNQSGGTANIVSSACDGIDADDLITISGGTIKVKAYEKTSLKVRRVNNQDRLEAEEAKGGSVASSFRKFCIREGKTDGFEINGGTVICESYKVSTPRKSKQKVIICKASKLVKGSAEESKKAVKWKIDGVASSEGSSVKYFYSSSSVTQKNYKILADGNEKETTWKWADNVGVAKVVSSTTV